jgi:ribosomal protein S18 acetylase RimI-like enzyme
VVEIRDLTPADAPALTEFTCDRWWQPRDWAEVADMFIRRVLATGGLGGANRRAVGLWDEGQLAGVASWELQSQTRWYVEVIAVHVDYQSRRYGRRLKLAVLSEARASNVSEVWSLVDIANKRMRKLNDKLGGVSRIDPEDRTKVIYVFRPKRGSGDEVSTGPSRRENTDEGAGS